MSSRSMSSASGSATKRRAPIAVFMCFGTQGDVYPVAALAAAFASDVKQYSVYLITHSAHQQKLISPLARKHVMYRPISSPPCLSSFGDIGNPELSISQQKKSINSIHRQECLSEVERIFGNEAVMGGDFIVINLFALEGWSLAELFQIHCVVAAPYVVPYSAPSSFEHRFMKELPLLYDYLQEGPDGKVCWKDIMHWMWPLFCEGWGSWRSNVLNLSPIPYTDPVTSLPMWHERAASPLVLYGFSEDIVECPDYWPSNVRVCGFWFPPIEWQFSCQKCSENSALVSLELLTTSTPLCAAHMELKHFLDNDSLRPLIFIGFSSIGSMGFVRNPAAFLLVLQAVIRITNYRFILFTASYEPLNAAVLTAAAGELGSCTGQLDEDGILLFSGRLFCFSGSIPYRWLFRKCAAALHHGGRQVHFHFTIICCFDSKRGTRFSLKHTNGVIHLNKNSGSTSAALHAGTPQVICPFVLDQFYWAERMFWLGVAPAPLQRCRLLPENSDDGCVIEAAYVLSEALSHVLTAEVKARASEISSKISPQDGVSEAVKILKEEICCF